MRRLRKRRSGISATLRGLRKRRKVCKGWTASGRRRKRRSGFAKFPWTKMGTTSSFAPVSTGFGWPEGDIYAANPRRSSFRYKMKNFLGGATSAFKKDTLMGAAPIVGGMVTNAMVRTKLGQMDFMPSFLKTGGMGNLGLGIITAGLIGGIAGMAAPKYAGSLLIGGLADVVMGLVNSTMGLSNCAGCQGLGCVGCGAMLAGPADAGVYLTEQPMHVPSNMMNSQTEGIMADAMNSKGDDLFD